MSKYTKAERHAIYVGMLEKFMEFPWFLCNIAHCHFGVQLTEIPSSLPELWAYQGPDDIDGGGGWWPWSPKHPKGNAARIEALKNCIELTKPTPDEQ